MSAGASIAIRNCSVPIILYSCILDVGNKLSVTQDQYVQT